MNTNLILKTDSYKLSMPKQYPPGTTRVYSYIESRGGLYHEILYAGLQAFTREYLSKPITMANIDEAEVIVTAHGEPFYRENWEYIVKKHGGYLPLRIKGLDEGSIVSPGTVMVTVENTDPKCYWLTTHIETMLLRAIWYVTTVASNSYASRQVILEALEETGDPASIGFKLHDFGARGVSSGESAMLGGMAHLMTGAMGTDTIEGILGAMRYYDSNVCGFSIPAMEHSTVTSWGRENEADAFRNMLKTFGKPGAIVAFVSDSYDIYERRLKHIWGEELKDEVIKIWCHSWLSVLILVILLVVVTDVVRALDGANTDLLSTQRDSRSSITYASSKGTESHTETIRGILQLVQMGWLLR
jgi:nicotinamide phosphoribosyltransferase